MDDSMMSIENNDHFDDDDFINQSLNSNNNLNQCNSDAHKNPLMSNKIDISELISAPQIQQSNIPKHRIDFNTLDTPRNCSAVRDRKRKNFSRRCLSSVLNGEHSENDQMSFQDYRCSKEMKRTNESTPFFKSTGNFLYSIENTISPNHKLNISLELTPEFNTLNNTNKQQQKSKDENDFVQRFPLKVSSNNNVNRNSGGMTLQKCFSENHASIMRAVQISSSDPTLIGDFTRTYALPLMQNSKHRDLKSITCHVLADLLQRRYANFIESFTIIDCRYPYEYEGGHIKTAINIYTQDDIFNRFIQTKTKEAEISKETSTTKRDILIFHCEFSSERGPNLCRFLRNKDRVKNSRVYPNLHYPEIYLLDGGYKEFYTHYSNLCEPCGYQPMYSKNHEEDLKKFRSICKSFDLKYSCQKRKLHL